MVWDVLDNGSSSNSIIPRGILQQKEGIVLSYLSWSFLKRWLHEGTVFVSGSFRLQYITVARANEAGKG